MVGDRCRMLLIRGMWGICMEGAEGREQGGQEDDEGTADGGFVGKVGGEGLTAELG